MDFHGGDHQNYSLPDMILCSFIGINILEGSDTLIFRVEGTHSHSSTLKEEAAGSSVYQTTQNYILKLHCQFQLYSVQNISDGALSLVTMTAKTQLHSWEILF